MPSDDELRRIRAKGDWSDRERVDYKKLWWSSRRIIDFILRFPRFVKWMRWRPLEPESRIGQSRRLLRESKQNPGEQPGSARDMFLFSRRRAMSRPSHGQPLSSRQRMDESHIRANWMERSSILAGEQLPNIPASIIMRVFNPISDICIRAIGRDVSYGLLNRFEFR
jgi:hypothetical protein